MADYNPTDVSNLPEINLDDFVDLANSATAFEAQTGAQSEPECSSSGQYSQYNPGVINGQYQLLDFAAFDIFLGSQMDYTQFTGMINDMRTSQQPQGLFSSNFLLSGYSQEQQNQAPYHDGCGFNGQYGCDDLGTDHVDFSFAEPPPSNDTISNLGAAEISSPQQPSQSSIDPILSSASRKLPAQQSSMFQGRLDSASLSCSAPPSGQGLVMANLLQPIGGLLQRLERPEATKSLRMVCNWQCCQRIHLQTREELSNHQQAHYNDLIEAAKRTNSFFCEWEHCKLQKLVKILKSIGPLSKHLKQHVKPHWCSHGSCNLAFSRRSDLNRHIHTIHSEESLFLCPFADCDRSIDGFTRNDKLQDHTKKAHTTFRCSLDHCEVQVLENEIQNRIEHLHTASKEGFPRERYIYECGLFGCETSMSKFTASSARGHLVGCHGVSYWGASSIVTRAHVVHPVDASAGAKIMKPYYRTKNDPCTHCIKGQNTNSSGGASINHIS